ncbi:MAG TPA: penicillin-binding transpeptidase domain-containing protein [Thermoleophilaceae bacterium]|nr:penicillin-binding transpeptidase domain-containing protein [Thermoleophilaceae bacterium]
MAADLTLERRRRLTHRALPAAAVVAVLAFVLGLTVGGGNDSETERVAKDFSAAWQKGDYAAMHRLLSADSRAAVTRERFATAYGEAAATATTRRLAIADPETDGDVARLPVTAHTAAFGPVDGQVELPVVEGAVDWRPHLVFPGLAPGEALSRRTTAPERAKLLTADDQVLAEGPADGRGSPLAVASSIAGTLEAPADEAEQERVYARGFPEGTPVGVSGLERVFEDRLAGQPGGELLAGTRVLARSAPRPGKTVKTTIDTGVQEAADTALAGRLGGVAALDPRSGEILALAGVAFSAPQPPGSTFKIVTAAAALEAGKVEPKDEFPVETAATIDGVELANANGESCGGDFANSFAHSCNSVFAPLGVEVGSKRLVEEAEDFGWNEDPGIPGALPSTIPDASAIVSPLEVGSTAIGQFQTLATTLQMASVAQTIANGGIRMRPTLRPRPNGAGGIRAIPADVAKTVERLMVGVVDYGTGTLAQVEGVDVAGKTGTAELGDTRGDDPEAALRDGDPTNTDAWFTAYAPSGKPRVVVAVLLVRNGAGGSTAAPAAQGVLVAGLKR